MSQQTKKKISIKPLGNRVLVQRLEQEDTSKGGIILPDTAKKKQEVVEVVAIGKENSAQLKEGDKILMEKYAGQEITIDDAEYIVLKADDVIAIIQE